MIQRDRVESGHRGDARLNIDHDHIEAGDLAHHFERPPDVPTADDHQPGCGRIGLDEDTHFAAAQRPDRILPFFRERVVSQVRLSI